MQHISNIDKTTTTPEKIINFDVSGNLLRIASIVDETWQENTIDDPISVISLLETFKPIPDIFTFSQTILHPEPKYNFYYELENAAVIPITTYDEWWDKQISTNNRKRVRRAYRDGIKTKTIDFDDALVKGIMNLYNESPVRQGKHFWHFGKDYSTVEIENKSYIDRAEFIGAFYQNELIGFIKIVYVNNTADIMQILSSIKHRDKFVMNALIAKAVEICAENKTSHFIYGDFSYGKKGEDSLTVFKKHNGFIKIEFPRYYIPLTMKGQAALKLGLHRGYKSLLPRWILLLLLKIRSIYFKGIVHVKN